MAEKKDQEAEDQKPPNPNPQHPGNPKTAEQLQQEREAQKARDEAMQRQR